MMTRWYKDKARGVFEKRLEACMRSFSNYEKPKLIIRELRRRWGSMTNNNALTLNIKLIRAPIECIDYVIVHELCHLKHLNHSSSFWGFLNQKYPLWRKRKHQLEMLLK